MTILLDVRFPHPDFLSGYSFPDTFFPGAEPILLGMLDVAVLTGLIVAAWFFLYRARSRMGLLAVTAASLVYLGFIRGGCPCPIGLIHQVAALAFRPDSVIGILSLAVFLVPLVAAFAKGRLYCSSVCPLGAVQELLLLKPVRLPYGVIALLSSLPPLYLGAVLAFSFTGGPSVVCLADPFVALFHLSGPWYRYLLLAAFAGISMVVYRPYCRFFCPYGLLLRGAARFSGSVHAITTGRCIDCGLCDAHCPAQAVRSPDDPVAVTKRDGRRLLRLLALLPAATAAFTFAGWFLGGVLSQAHPDVYLGRVLETMGDEIPSPAGRTEAEKTADAGDPVLEALLERAGDRSAAIARSKELERTVRLWMGAAGVAASLFFVARLAGTVRRRRRTRREPAPGDCFSCGRCTAGCPVERAGFRTAAPAREAGEVSAHEENAS